MQDREEMKRESWTEQEGEGEERRERAREVGREEN